MGEAGFFALFFGSAAVGVAAFGLRGWQAWLKSRNAPGHEEVLQAVQDLRTELRDFMLQQDDRMEDLQSRLDFAERLLASPKPELPADEVNRAHSASSIPTTQFDLIPSILNITSSTSDGYMFSPPEMIKSTRL